MTPVVEGDTTDDPEPVKGEGQNEPEAEHISEKDY